VLCHSRHPRSEGGEDEPDEPKDDSGIGDIEKACSEPTDTDAKKIDDVPVVEQAI
jgi:hypothetical protein